MTSSKVVVFRCGAEDYAVQVEHVISIEKVEMTNRIPHLPEYMDGLTKTRGELLPILDFERILYNRAAEGELCRLLVLTVEDFTFALKVLEAKEILDIDESAMSQVGLLNYARTSYFTAVANLEERMITLVSPSILVNSLEGIKEIKKYVVEMKSEQQGE